jgi:hypothetical protein
VSRSLDLDAALVLILERARRVGDNLRDEIVAALERDGRTMTPTMDRLHRMVNDLAVIRATVVGILEDREDEVDRSSSTR